MILKVNEIFYSIQGESRWIGYPCVFVRLAGCNLRCAWCDTTYAYDSGVDMTVREIVDRVRAYQGCMVELTGGEPLMQAHSADLLRALLELGYRVLLETNGTMSLRTVPGGVVRIMDVKCPSSGEQMKTLAENFDLLTAEDDVKFVVRDRADFDFALSVIGGRALAGRCGIIFSPVWGRTPLDQLASWVLQSGIEARMQVQLHKVIWGAGARGV
ncbi:MAG: radical SAM protein [Acidobacteriota bacterium]